MGLKYRRAFERAGLVRVMRQHGDRLVKMAVLPCGSCSAEYQFAGESNNAPPDQLLLKAARAGWCTDARGKNPTACPDCLAAEEAADESVEDAVRHDAVAVGEDDVAGATAPEHEEGETMVGTGDGVADVDGGRSAAPPVGMNMRLTRAVMTVLEEHFDEALGMYRDTWSDERVAEETQASEAYVKAVRREAFGDVRMTPELQQVREGIDDVLVILGGAEKELQAVNKRLGDLVQECMARVTRLDEKFNLAVKDLG